MDNLSSRLVLYLVGAASVFIILAGFRDLAPILNPVLLALVITVTVLPVPGWLTRRGVPGWASLVLTILLVVLILALVIATVFLSITSLFRELPAYLASASTQVNESMPDWLNRSDTPFTQTELTLQLGPAVQRIFTTVANLLVQFGLALFIFFFMISAAISLPGAARLGLTTDTPVIRQITTLTGDVRHYMTILTGINFLVGVGNTIFLWILGVDFAVLWGILAWFMGYIPSIGFIIALIPPLIIAYAQYGLSTALLVLVGYVLINGGVQNFVQPKIMGQGLKISPVVVFIGLFTWGYLLGGIGAILAVPLTLLILTILENFEGTSTLAILMRYTGESKEKEHREAISKVKEIWGKTRDTFTLTEDKPERDEARLE